MGITDLQAAQTALTNEVAAIQQQMSDLSTSITNEIARVEAAIASLGGGGQIDAVTAALNTAVANLQGVANAMTTGKSALDAEQAITVQQG